MSATGRPILLDHWARGAMAVDRWDTDTGTAEPSVFDCLAGLRASEREGCENYQTLRPVGNSRSYSSLDPNWSDEKQASMRTLFFVGASRILGREREGPGANAAGPPGLNLDGKRG